jgi:type IV fimbrial biogenesis protein FimT
MSQTAARTRLQGFTLIEFLVTMSVLVIALRIAAPALGTFVAQNQSTALKSSFTASVALARSEAARAGIPVVLQASNGGAVGNEYANGWDLYLDNDGSGTVSAGDTQLRHYDALPPGVKLSGTATLVFSASGYLTPAANVAYHLCRVDGSGTGYLVSLAPNGTAYTSTGNGCP